MFSKFVNLNELIINNNYSSATFKHRNRFYGSLKPLSNLIRLKKLDISSTDVDSGLEYLPANLEEIMTGSGDRSEGKVEIIEKQLEPYTRSVGSYEDGYYECEYMYYDYQA
jgi:hypothetical protein